MHHQRESRVKFLNCYRIITELLLIIITQFFLAVIKKNYSCIFQIFMQYAINWYYKCRIPSRGLRVNLTDINVLDILTIHNNFGNRFWGLMLVF